MASQKKLDDAPTSTPPARRDQGAMVTKNDALRSVRGLLAKMQDQFKAALPRHIEPDRFLRIAMTEITRTPALLDCSQQSLLGSLMECAQIGLEPGPLGYAYLVPYKRRVTLIPGYKGLVALARRSGEVSTIYAQCVFERDEFDFAFGLEPILEHKPTREDDPGEMIAAYAVCRFKDGGAQFEVMWKRQIDAIRARSAAGKSGPWVTDYPEMAKKTVVRRLSKMLPLTPEAARAVALDEQNELGIPQDLTTIDITPEDGGGDGPKGALDEAADRLADADGVAKEDAEPEKKP